MSSSNNAVLNYLHFGGSDGSEQDRCEQDSKETVVVLHGLFGNARNLSSLSRALQDTKQVYSLDLPNHGSSPSTDDMSFASMAQAVVDTMQALGVHKFHLLGHSLGGKVAMALALLYPQMVGKLIVADIAPVKYQPSHSPYFAAMLSLPKSTGSRAEADQHLAQTIDDAGLRQFLLQNLQKQGEGYGWRIPLQKIIDQYDIIRDKFNSDELLAAKPFEGPTLFIRGSLSDYIQEAHEDDIAALFPSHELAQVDGAGHWLHAEKPQEFNQIVRDFLKN